MSDDSNLGPLADEFGEVRAQLAELKEREQKLRSEILETGAACLRGDRFIVGIRQSQITRLDPALIRTKMGQQWTDAHSKQIKCTTLKVTARPKRLPKTEKRGPA